MTQLPREHIELRTGDVGMLPNRPICGSSDAPLRRYIAIARSLNRAGYEVMNSDRCVFAKHVSAKHAPQLFIAHGKLAESAILIHVCDISYVGHSRDRANFESCVNFFLRGELDDLQAGKPWILAALRFNCSRVDASRFLRMDFADKYLNFMRMNLRAITKCCRHGELFRNDSNVT